VEAMTCGPQGGKCLQLTYTNLKFTSLLGKFSPLHDETNWLILPHNYNLFDWNLHHVCKFLKIGDKGQELGTNDQIKVSNLDESYNFVVAHFFIWNHFTMSKF